MVRYPGLARFNFNYLQSGNTFWYVFYVGIQEGGVIKLPTKISYNTSTEQGKKEGVLSCENPGVIWLDRSM
jgi:hypothetical protein